jgi:ATP-binding cassette subfamily F protein uup
VDGAYAELLEARDALLSNQASYQESLANRVRSEVAGLRRGAKARTRKSKARIDAAQRSISELAEGRERADSASASAGLELNASGRKTKRLWYGRELSKRFRDALVIDELELLLVPGMRLGVVGPIGSGKSTLLRMIVGELAPDAGEIRKVDDLKTVYFDQGRSALDTDQTLRRALAPEGDSVIYRDRSVHVVGWAKRFLFRPAQLDQPVSRLSGGERARVALARLMLQPADLLVLDEPTNDLDIATLEVLEESLIDFPGALVLVSHDRHLLDRVSTDILALDGRVAAERYADYDQWQSDRRTTLMPDRGKSAATERTASRRKAKRLTYLEQQEWEGMEEQLLAAEARLDEARLRAADPAIATDAAALQQRLQALDEVQAEVDRLYARWAELETKA